MKQIFIIEDEIIVAKGIENILTHNSYTVIDIATSYTQAKQKLLSLRPDLILCDINLSSEKTGIDLMEEFSTSLQIPFIFISSYSDIETIRRADHLLPHNYITKPFTEKQLLISVQRAFLDAEMISAQAPTERELAILRLVAHGYSTKEIADTLNIAFNTVESHRKNLMKKFAMNSMTELVCMATSNGWIEYQKR